MLLQNFQLDFLENILSDEGCMPNLQPANNISIYRNNIMTTLMSTLQNIYPLIVALLGDDYFHMIAKEYVKRYPSLQPNLHEYGEYLSRFLSEYEPLHNYPYLKEVAEFEWICHTLYFAEDSNDFDIDFLKTLSEKDYDHLHLKLNPASSLAIYTYPLLKIIDLCNGTIDTLDIREGGIHLLIIRRAFKIDLHLLTPAEYCFLKSLQDELTFAEALNETLKIEADFKLEEKLLKWVQDKTIVNFYLQNHT